MYLLWSGLVIYGFAAGMFSLVVRLAALAAITTIAARSLRLPTILDYVPYTCAWAGVAVILDAVFLVPFSGFVIYSSWSVWVGYALVALIPLVTSIRRSRAAVTTHI